MEAEEAQFARLDEEISALHELLHPQKHLRTIPKVSPRIAPLLLAAVGVADRFRRDKAFRQWIRACHVHTSLRGLKRSGIGTGKAALAGVKRALC